MSAGCSVARRSSEIFSFTRRAGSVSMRSTNSHGIMRGGILASSACSGAAGTMPFSSRRMAPRAPDIDRGQLQDDVPVPDFLMDVDVVDPHDLAAVHVDDLLVEQVAPQQKHAFAVAVRRPLCGQCANADSAVDGADRLGAPAGDRRNAS